MEFAEKWRTLTKKFQQYYNKCNERKRRRRREEKSSDQNSKILCSCARVCVCVFLFECESRRADFLLYRIKDTLYYCVLMLFLSHESEKKERHAGRIFVPLLLAFYLFYFICCLLLCLFVICWCVSSGGDFLLRQREKINFFLCVFVSSYCVCGRGHFLQKLQKVHNDNIIIAVYQVEIRTL